MFDKNTQTATLIYNDRVNTYRQMKVLSDILDNKPTAQTVMQLVELRIQNLICFKELQTFNDTGQWLYQHPLISNQSKFSTLQDLKRKNPEEFFKQYALTESNIRRYQSYIKSETRKDKRNLDRQNLQKHKDLSKIFKSILENE